MIDREGRNINRKCKDLDVEESLVRDGWMDGVKEVLCKTARTIQEAKECAQDKRDRCSICRVGTT